MIEWQNLFLLSTRVSNCTPGWTFRTIDINHLEAGLLWHRQVCQYINPLEAGLLWHRQVCQYIKPLEAGLLWHRQVMA